MKSVHDDPRDGLRLRLARLPSVQVLQRQAAIQALRGRYEDREIDAAIREVLRGARDGIRFRPHGEEVVPLEPRDLADRVVETLERASRSRQGESINASGILFHPRTRDQNAGTAARRAADLSLTLAAYEENGRIARLLRKLTGAEDALVARSVPEAFLLAVQALARDREVVIARSQLGLTGTPCDDRLVDPVSVCALAGAGVVETGATNRTRLSDYRSAMGARTALIASVRPSSYSLRGFTEETGLEEIARAGEESGTPVLHLAGETTLRPVGYGADEPARAIAACSVAEAIGFGTPLVIAAGGGVVGGPPCGLLVGSRHVIERLREHETWSALQASRHARAGLEARLAELAGGRSEFDHHPAAHALTASREEVGARARTLVDLLSKQGLPGLECTVVEKTFYLTTYRLPDESMPGFAVSVRGDRTGPEALAVRWAKESPALLVEYDRDRISIHMRGVKKDRIPEVARIVETGW